MKKSEMVKIFSILAIAYPKFDSFDVLRNPQSADPVVTLWHEMLGDFEFCIVEIAVKKLILESPYPPTIADVRKRAVEVVTPEDEKLDAAQAWGEVEKAIRHFGYYREAEAFTSMSPRTVQITKYLNWQEICLCEELGVIRGQFIKLYNQMSERENKAALIPEKLKQQINQIGKGINNVRYIENVRSIAES